MNTCTNLEDLSNEIFFEIFDYLHALEVFTGFTSLNKRISSILQTIPLRVVILYKHCRCQIDFLSSHLSFHAHQVISLKVSDTIRDDSSIISLLFNQHNFINLESCIFISIKPATKLKNVIKQIKYLNRLVSFVIHQPVKGNINENDKYDLTRALFMHKSSSLRSLVLRHHYHFQDILNYSSISSNLMSLYLSICGSPSAISVYSALPILRLCHTIRKLGVSIEQIDSFQDNSVNVASSLSSINDLPILPRMISLDLIIFARCDVYSISYILRCMPNLIRLNFILSTRTTMWPFPGELLDGDVWKQMLELYVPCLSKFEFHMAIMKRFPKLDLDIVVNSFEYFVETYANWQMVIDRWKLTPQVRGEFIVLRTLNYHKQKTYIHADVPLIRSHTFQTRSTASINDHCLFYSNQSNLRMYIKRPRSTVTWSSPLFQQITYLIVALPIISSTLWDNLLNIVNFRATINDDDAQQYVTYLSHFVYLPNIIQLQFPSMVDIFYWKYIQFILQACPNVINLIIGTRLLVYSKLIDNPSLLPIFKQIKLIESITIDTYFPAKFASKLVQRFPSLSHIALLVFSFDNCVSVIDIFLTQLENLSCIKINYDKDTLLDDPFSRDYIIEKRRQIFPMNILNEDMVNVRNNGIGVEIWLR